MAANQFQRTVLGAALAVGAAFQRPLAADGLIMDPVMSAFIRFANRMAGRGRGPMDLAGLRRRYAASPALLGLPS